MDHPRKMAWRLKTAAYMLDMTEPTLRDYIGRGEIQARKLDRSVLVPVSEMERFLRGERREGDADSVQACT